MSWDDVFNGTTRKESDTRNIDLARIMYSWHKKKQTLLPEDVINYLLDMDLLTEDEFAKIKDAPLKTITLPTTRKF